MCTSQTPYIHSPESLAGLLMLHVLHQGQQTLHIKKASMDLLSGDVAGAGGMGGSHG